VLLRGTREGTEEERLRRQQEYRRNRPEAIERRRKMVILWVCLGVLSFVLALVSTLWVNA